MPNRRLFLVSLLAALAGCAVGPHYARPEAPLPVHYLSQTGAESQAPVAPADLVRWWQRFDDPQLVRLVTGALAQNLELAQAGARVAQARAGLGAAQAALLPSGAVAGSASRAYQSVETPLGRVLDANPDVDRWGTSYEANLSAGWEVDVFRGLRRGREAALADYEASQAGVSAVRLAVAAQTADVYLTIRGLQSRLDIARRQVATQQELRARVQRLYEHGLAAEYQVRQTEGALARVQATLPALQLGLEAAMNALDVLLGAPPGTHRTQLEPAMPLPATPRIDTMGTPAELLQRRPDLIVAERRLAASNARIGEAVAEYYPKFSLSGLLGSATTLGSGQLFGSGASQAAGVLGLRWRLFDFGRIDAQIELARGRDAEALAGYRQAVLRATEEVENAFAALGHRSAQAQTLSQGETALARARASAFSAYQRGTASLIEVLQADDALLQVTDAQAQARTESARAAVAAFRALGGGWEPPSPQTMAPSTSRSAGVRQRLESDARARGGLALVDGASW